MTLPAFAWVPASIGNTIFAYCIEFVLLAAWIELHFMSAYIVAT
jgi:hypothetical protein